MMKAFSSPTTNKDSFIQRSFLQKGRYLRKKCGQIKAAETYLSPDVVFTNGLQKTHAPKIGHAAVVLSLDCLNCFARQLSSLDPHIASRTGSFIILQTALRHVLEQSDPQKNRSLRDLVNNLSATDFQICMNEFHKDMFVPQSDCRDVAYQEIFTSRNRSVAVAAKFLFQYLGPSTVLLVSDSKDPVLSYPEVLGIPVVTMEVFLERINARFTNDKLPTDKVEELAKDCRELLKKRDTMKEVNGSEIIGRQNLFPKHLPGIDAAAGIKSGAYLQGKFHIERGSATSAEVIIRGHPTCSVVKIVSPRDMNRALYGDTVAVKIFPQSKWVSWRSGILQLPAVTPEVDGYSELQGTVERSTDVSEAESNVEDLVPTGEIVCIVSSSSRDREIIAAFPPARSVSSGGQIGSDVGDRDNPISGKEEFILVAPVDKKLPKFRICTRQKVALSGKKVALRIDNWSRDSQYPNAHITRHLGASGDFKTEIAALLMENNISIRPFSSLALSCLPAVESSKSQTLSKEISNTAVDLEWKVSEEEVKSRKDLRKVRTIFSVDPSGCQDIDDAMSVHWICPGKAEISVHIADVCAFLPQGCALDVEAQRRGTTVYLPHTRIDMLPSLLSSDIASLHCNKDRYAVTVQWVVDVQHKNGTPLTRNDLSSKLSNDSDWVNNVIINLPEDPSWLGRTVIKSMAAMTYEQGHELVSLGKLERHTIDVRYQKAVTGGNSLQAGGPITPEKWQLLSEDLRLLTLLSRKLGITREENGAIDMSRDDGGAELKFQLDSGAIPNAVEQSEHLEIHDTIAELMIIANSAVAKYIYDRIPLQSLIRVHAPPSPHKLEVIREFCQQLGLGLFQTANIAEIMQQIPNFRRLLFDSCKSAGISASALTLLTAALPQSMSEALYMCSGDISGDLQSNPKSSDASTAVAVSSANSNSSRRGHYGLGLLHYTHFTSPIRRYADCMVHRQLLYSLSLNTGVKRTEEHLNIKSEILKGALQASNKNETLKEIMTQKPAATSVDLAISDNEDEDFLDSLLEDVGDDLSFATASISLSQSNAKENSNPKSSELEIEVQSIEFMKQVDLGLQKSREDAPYSSSEVCRITDHLNAMNRNSKRVQSDCQKLFVSLYFKNRSEEHTAIVHSVRENGFTVFIPHLDFKGAIYVKSKNGQVKLYPKLIENLKLKGPEYYNTTPKGQKESKDSIIEEVECPELSCELLGSLASSISAAKQHKSHDGEIASLILRRNVSSTGNEIIFSIKPLQKVCVLVTSKNNDAGVPDINLFLIDPYPKISSATVPMFHPESHIFGKLESKDPLKSDKIDQTTIKPTSSASKSLYNHLTSCLEFLSKSKRVSGTNPDSGASLPSTKSNNTMTSDLAMTKTADQTIKKLKDKSVSHVHRIKGTGRMAYGSDNQVSDVYKYSGQTGRNLAAYSGSVLKKGKEAAMERMKLWGEDWAEEEDLPGSVAKDSDNDDFKSSEGSASHYSSAMSAGSLVGAKLGKEISIASQRISKLKVAKKNSKY